MAGNVTSVADQNGEYDDWVELYNGNSFSLNLNGYYLSDNENDLTKWTFPNVSIPANDYLIVWCDTAEEHKVDCILLIVCQLTKRKYI